MMKEKKPKLLEQAKHLLYILLLFCGNSYVNAQCVIGCNPNTFVNSVDPNTIEYDNIVSSFHATVIKDTDGTFKTWGEATMPNGTGSFLSPTAITPANGFAYTGTPLKATTASFYYANPSATQYLNHQHALLTTDGLYVWGNGGSTAGQPTLVSKSLTTSAAFQKITVNGKADGLPPGVLPNQVKMMFGSGGTLAITTCSGEAWVLSMYGDKNGDGTPQDATNNVIWHRVKTSATADLNGVVAMRGTSNALFALTSDGKLYTWGTGTYINNGIAATNRMYATEVTAPAGVTPKMIGMTSRTLSITNTTASYFLLGTNGKLYAMGDNASRQLGDGTTTIRTNWIQPQKVTDQSGQGTGNLENIVWISPNEHSYFNTQNTSDISTGAINVLTNDHKQWAWGSNNGRMIGGATTNTYYDAMYMPGSSAAANGLKITDELIAVETGGHTSMNIKKGENKFGYVGHYINGSMGNGVVADSYVPTYSYETAIVMVCGAEVGPAVQDLTICNGTTANLNNANLTTPPSEVEWHATNSATSPVITNITAVAVGTYYAFYTVASGKPRVVGSAATVTGVVCCTTADCNPNTFVNSSDPNTLEYDNIVSAFHSTIVKESNGTFKVWGELSAPAGNAPLYSPTAITPANSFNYTGTPLRATAGSNSINNVQFALLTTDGLYIWGTANTLISSTIKSTTAFGKITVNGKADGLPAGVIPGQVKSMFGSYGTLAITTCSGEAWVLSFNGSKNGDGTAQDATNNVIWHRVKTSATADLTGVVAMRGTSNALFALTSDSKLYTWGTNTYINSGAATSRTYATEVSLPSGATPKMIGMTQSSGTNQAYYLLATDGKLYTMGTNTYRQLGNGSTTASNTWVQPQKMTNQSGQGTGALVDIAWISPNEHDGTVGGTAPSVNVLTTNNKQWAWGSNDTYMIGAPTNNSYNDPIYMPGASTNTNGMKVTDEIIAIETGGHTSMNIKKGDNRFGYVGHYVNGSIGNGTNVDSNVSTYTYNTASVTVCGADVAPYVKNIYACQNTTATANLNDANLETTPAQIEWHATNDVNSPVMTNITAVPAGTYYAFFTVASGRSRTLSSAVTVTSRVCLSPGGVNTGLSYWYRADKNATNTGATTDVTAWTDMWNGTTVAQLGTNALPKYAVGTSSYFNFNPGINFTVGTQTLGNNTVQTLTSLNYDVFTFTKEGMTGGTNSRLFSIGMDNTTTGASNWDAFGISSTSNVLERRVFAAGSQLLAVNPAYSGTIPNIMYFRNTDTSSIRGLNGAAFPGAATTYNAQGNQFGGHIFGSSLFSSNGSDNTGFVGNVGETIVYGAGTLSDTDRRRVDSYLAIKYGITLGQLSATGHYLDTDGNIVWNGGSNTTYNNNIFGVSRDDVEVFEQKVSRSVNSGTILTVATINDFVNQNQDAARTGFANDKTYFLLGDNNVTTTGLTAITANSIAMNRIARIWLSQRKNTPNLLYFQASLGTYGTTFASGNTVYMVVADDAAFTTNVKTIAGTYVSATAQWVFSNSFDSDNVQRYITFATSGAATACPAGTTAPTVNAAVANNCPTTTVNLNTQAHTGTIPANTTLVWFTNNAHTGTAYATPTAATTGTYYAFYYSSASNCYSPASNAVTVTTAACPCPAGTTAPAVNTAVANLCPATTVNLNTQAHTGAIPVNATLVWFTNNAHTGTAYATPTAATAGTYYAFYYSSTGDCYTPASNPVTVTINACPPCTAADPMPANLSSINVPAAPAGAVTQWHNSATPSASTLLSSTTVMATSTPTNYWVYYYDATNHCYSPGSKATVVSNACCNYPTVNLSQLSHSAVPNGSTLVWYANSTHDFGTQVSDPLAVGNGTYWPFFYDAVSNCYSPAGTPVIVAVDNVCSTACYKPGITTGTALDTKVGISALGRAGEDDADKWPMTRKGGWIALEAKTKGFVPNRVAFSDADNNASTPDVPVGIDPANFVEGMMVYDTTHGCMKVYTLKDGDMTMAWHCVTTQTCPD